MTRSPRASRRTSRSSRSMAMGSGSPQGGCGGSCCTRTRSNPGIRSAAPGEAELAIASDRILALRSVKLPLEGATVEIPVDAAWGSGVYALVTAYRPQNTGATGPGARGPGRAVGVAWLGIDVSPKTLSVALAAPDVARPRGPGESGGK